MWTLSYMALHVRVPLNMKAVSKCKIPCFGKFLRKHHMYHRECNPLMQTSHTAKTNFWEMAQLKQTLEALGLELILE